MNDNKQLNSTLQKKYLTLGKQLSYAENLLRSHPLVSERFAVLQSTLHAFNLQTRWNTAGSLGRLQMTFESALLGLQTKESETGFIGPSLDKFQRLTVQLMQNTFDPSAIGFADFLLSITQLMTWGIVYLTTQTLGDWKRRFPPQDPGGMKQAGLLLRELGLIYFLGSHVIDQTYSLIGKDYGLNERNQKILGNVGLLYVLIILVALQEDNKNPEEIIETLHTYMPPTLESIEQAFEKAQDRGLLDEENLATALSQIQMLRLTLENHDLEALQEAFESSFQLLDISYKAIKEDVKTMVNLCSQLNQTFKNIFNQNETAMTTMTQAA